MVYILRFLDRFLPDSMRTSATQHIRGYVLVGLIFTNMIISILAMASLAMLLELHTDRNTALGIVAICIMGYTGVLVLLHYTENYTLCCNVLLALITAVIQWGLLTTGGYLTSPVLQMILLVPVMGFLLLGLHGGILWLALTFGVCLLNYLFATYGVGYIRELQYAEVDKVLYTFLQFCLLGLVGAALLVYETLNGMLREELHEERINLQYQASHDDLTGVANRFAFFRRLLAAIDEAQERAHTVGVVYIDLDGFKPVNDNHGHHVGDFALKTIAARLQEALRLSDTTARLGGDEFGLILPAVRLPEDIELIMPKVLEAIRRPIGVDGAAVHVDGSCGIAVYPHHSRDHDELCRFADTAMYCAKASRDSWLIYDHHKMASSNDR